ncbi:MAG: hypothetical protein JWN34_1823 [Bryobacterales bacterium]|nr:hypothetical protein [Bryobacterales bacterium]
MKPFPVALALAGTLWAQGLLAQTPNPGPQATPAAGNAAILDRLDKLERQNSELQAEIQKLRQELAARPAEEPVAAAASPPAASTEERLDIQEKRTEELAQSKLDTSQRMPVELTGMLLFNAFSNGKFGGVLQNPVTAGLTRGPANTGGSFRQTVLGLRFHGPALPGGGKAEGSFYMDFFGGAAAPTGNLLRIRLATIDLIWKNTTITAGQDKPIVAPREPSSLAQVGLAPLTGAGNLWNWQPQVRILQRFRFSETMGIRAEAGVFQTAEVAPGNTPAAIAGTLERARPAWETRVNFYRGNDDRGFEIAPGFHHGNSHIGGFSVPSKLFTLDWSAKPVRAFEFTGAMFKGQNAAGLGSLRQGFTVSATPFGTRVNPVHATGMWGQLTWFTTPKLSFHVFGGAELDRPSDLVSGMVRQNIIYAGNAIYKLAPNILAAFEVSQNRTLYLTNGLRLNNHYDLALAYLF